MRTLLILAASATLASAEGTAATDAIAKAAAACEPARARCFGVHVHVAPAETGLVVTADWVAAQLATANRHFAALDVGFQVTAVDTLPASAAHLRTRADRSALGARLGGRVIHVFVTGQLDNVDDTAPVYGVTWREGRRKFIILAANARSLVLAHELGHVFGLPHSTHAISIMNKTKREAPPIEERTFADEEVAAMRRALERLVRAKVLADVRP